MPRFPATFTVLAKNGVCVCRVRLKVSARVLLMRGVKRWFQARFEFELRLDPVSMNLNRFGLMEFPVW